MGQVFHCKMRQFSYKMRKLLQNATILLQNATVHTFQTQLLNDVKKIKDSHKIFVPADKSRNIYLISKDEYQKLLTEDITKTYKMTNRRKVYDINNETNSIAKRLSIDKRTE